MDEMVFKYWKEAFDREVVKSDCGFASYKITGEECYVVDIFIHPDFRRQKGALELAERISAIAKERGCKVLTGTVPVASKDPTGSIAAQLFYGFKLHSANERYLTFFKEL